MGWSGLNLAPPLSSPDRRLLCALCTPNPCCPCHPLCPQVWGNWEHLACRGPRVTYTKFRVRARRSAL